MAKKQKVPAKWHVCQLGGNYYALSDDQLAKMGDQERAAYRFVKAGFDSAPDAMNYMVKLRWGGEPGHN